MLRKLVVFLALTSVALAATAIGLSEPKPDKFKNVEGCYLEELDQVIPPGDTAPSKEGCLQYRCLGDLVQQVSCGSVACGPNLKKVEDLSQPYPGCCATCE